MTDPITEVSRLVEHFRADQTRLCVTASVYTETEARIEYIDPLFACLGWDMSNTRGLPNSIKDVVREESQPTETSAKRPDYTFRIGAVRKFFVEAKKPAVDIRTNRESAFQVRSYGWTAGMAVSILTNFRTLRVYDTQTAPTQGDNADVGLLLEINFEELPIRFGELQSIFGRDEVAQGSIEAHYGMGRGAGLPIGSLFLDRFNDWRLRIASDLHSRHNNLTVDELNDMAQKLINRMIFIRMCEDRGIEGEERLRTVASTMDHVELRRLFQEMDERYNTGLFDVTEDPMQSQYRLDSQLFLDIVEELYFPLAPYSFSVLDADFLGQVYEHFLVQRLVIDGNDQVRLEKKPAYEDREVVTTPQPLVDEIVRRTLLGRFGELEASGDLTFDILTSLRVIDIAVGSSRFLLRCLDQLVDAAIAHFVRVNDSTMVYQRAQNEYRLSFEAKKELLINCLYGIDIDYNAVEIARFSLLVKLLEDENDQTIPTGRRILPNLDRNIIWGNSVVGSNFQTASQDVMRTTNPLDWTRAGLPDSFDGIVGNPPYVKTEEMKVKVREEYEYYKNEYDTPYRQFDKYFVFIEKAIQKLGPNGFMGMVVPNKWMTIESGAKLRGLLAEQELVAEIVNFGNERLFEDKSTYVCLLIVSKSNGTRDRFWFSNVHRYNHWLSDPSNRGMELPYELLTSAGESSWVLPADIIEARVLSTLTANSVKLKDIAEVANGIQTSAEDVFPIEQWTEANGYITFQRQGRNWTIERAITRPYLMDSTNINSYKRIQADALIIFPYEYGANNKAILIPPQRLQSDFPMAWGYLQHFQQRLARRSVSPKPATGEFYRYGRHQALFSAFSSPKIIYSVNQLGDKYGIDNIGVGFASGGTAGEVSISTPRDGYSLEFILALLNQNVVEFFMRKRGSPFGGGYYSRGSAVVSDLPVPRLDFDRPDHQQLHNDIIRLVNQLIVDKEQLTTAAGRNRESITRNIAALQNEIKAQFDHLWDFQGYDQQLVLPGS
ncbi:Eco57I restriction-modification methylase domain-containing protein [Brevibacillus fortis]|uniref:Eco57I restriction-modification methylase domain-containing protein n=1 Tax=Brevibacillus fortis TaxID=2126352 RepID=UPI002E20E480|nr:Eco57I restriction-modification methylase domain-containing protein [Brevibacillus fortis]